MSLEINFNIGRRSFGINIGISSQVTQLMPYRLSQTQITVEIVKLSIHALTSPLCSVSYCDIKYNRTNYLLLTYFTIFNLIVVIIKFVIMLCRWH